MIKVTFGEATNFAYFGGNTKKTNECFNELEKVCLRNGFSPEMDPSEIHFNNKPWEEISLKKRVYFRDKDYIKISVNSELGTKLTEISFNKEIDEKIVNEYKEVYNEECTVRNC